MVDLSLDGSITALRLAELLAPTLGWEKGTEAVAAAVSRQGVPTTGMSFDQALSVLDDLSRAPGMVGIAARFARSRLESPRKPARPAASTQIPPSSRAPASSKSDTGRAVTADDVALLLTNAMGADKAQEIVQGAVRRLGFSADHLGKAEAMALLDHLAGEPGVVGLCARFGKARLILRFAA